MPQGIRAPNWRERINATMAADPVPTLTQPPGMRAPTLVERLKGYLGDIAQQPALQAGAVVGDIADELWRGKLRDDPQWKIGGVWPIWMMSARRAGNFERISNAAPTLGENSPVLGALHRAATTHPRAFSEIGNIAGKKLKDLYGQAKVYRPEPDTIREINRKIQQGRSTWLWGKQPQGVADLEFNPEMVKDVTQARKTVYHELGHSAGRHSKMNRNPNVNQVSYWVNPKEISAEAIAHRQIQPWTKSKSYLDDWITEANRRIYMLESELKPELAYEQVQQLQEVLPIIERGFKVPPGTLKIGVRDGFLKMYRTNRTTPDVAHWANIPEPQVKPDLFNRILGYLAKRK